jgi:DNA-directed RNA polymerase specialized sigma24 family protein
MAMNDSEIIEQSLRSPEAFSAIFDRHFDVIAGFCLRRLDAVRGEDVAGEVFRWAFEHRTRFDLEHDDARPWLFGIANNLVRQALRSAGRQGLAYDRWLTRETFGEDEIGFQVAATLDAQRDVSVVAAVLKRQPIEEVETLLLYAWEGSPTPRLPKPWQFRSAPSDLESIVYDSDCKRHSKRHCLI